MYDIIIEHGVDKSTCNWGPPCSVFFYFWNANSLQRPQTTSAMYNQKNFLAPFGTGVVSDYFLLDLLSIPPKYMYFGKPWNTYNYGKTNLYSTSKIFRSYSSQNFDLSTSKGGCSCWSGNPWKVKSMRATSQSTQLAKHEPRSTAKVASSSPRTP